MYLKAFIYRTTERARLNGNLLEKYRPYGWFGLINFARRTFYLSLRAGEVQFEYPVHLTVLPQYVLHARPLCGAPAVTYEEFIAPASEASRSGNPSKKRKILELELIDYTRRENTPAEKEIALLLAGEAIKARAVISPFKANSLPLK